MFKLMFPILLLTFVNVIGFTLMIPVLTDIAARYTNEALAPIVYGALLSSYALCQFLAAPILGSLSDRYGRRPMLFLSQAGTLFSWVIFSLAYFVPEISFGGIALPLIIIACSRVIDGLTGGNISVANAWISDVTSPEEKTKAFGLLGATFGMGFLIGPGIGGLSNATPIGYLGTGILAFCLSLITLLFVGLFLPESLPPEDRDDHVELHVWQEINIFHKFSLFRDNLFVKNLLMSRVAFALIFASYITIIVLFLESHFELGSVGLGLTLSFIGMFSVFNQAVLVGKVAKKGTLRAFFIGIGALVVGLSVIPVIPQYWVLDGDIATLFPFPVNISFLLFLLDAYCINIGISLAMPSFKALIANNVSKKNQGLGVGLDESILSFGQGVTPVLAGILYASIGIRTFWLYAFLLLVSHGWLWMKVREHLETE